MLAIEVGPSRKLPAETRTNCQHGGLTRGEWRPLSARLFAAMVAADGTGDRCRVTDGSELEWFEQLPPPVIHADATPCHQPLRPRYVVRHEGSASKKSSHPQYLFRIPVEIRPGVRVAPRNPQVTYAWDVEPPAEVLDALRRRAARVGYLGAADSPVRLRVGTSPPELEAWADQFTPDPAGTLAISRFTGIAGSGHSVRALDEDTVRTSPVPSSSRSPSGQLQAPGRRLNRMWARWSVGCGWNTLFPARVSVVKTCSRKLFSGA